jgi:hypothetical protein
MGTAMAENCLEEVVRFVESIARASERLIHNLLRCLHTSEFVQESSILKNIKNYKVPKETSIDIYVNATLVDSNMVDWCLEIAMSGSGLQIQIETSIRLSHSHGNDIVTDIPVQQAHTIDEFDKTLNLAVTLLLAVRTVECSEVRPEDLVVLNKLLASLPDDVMV